MNPAADAAAANFKIAATLTANATQERTPPRSNIGKLTSSLRAEPPLSADHGDVERRLRWNAMVIRPYVDDGLSLATSGLIDAYACAVSERSYARHRRGGD